MLDSTAHSMLAADHCTRWLGATVLLAEPGHARISMQIRAEMTNGFGIAHGGMVFALADTCFAMACNDPGGDGETVTVAAGADINFMATAALGDELVAESFETARAGRSGVYDVVVSRGETTVALFRGRSRTVPRASR